MSCWWLVFVVGGLPHAAEFQHHGSCEQQGKAMLEAKVIERFVCLKEDGKRQQLRKTTHTMCGSAMAQAKVVSFPRPQ